MLELSNQGPWSAGLYPGFQLNQEFQWTCVIKASFEFDKAGKLTPLPEQLPIEETDQHYGKPLQTSLKIANEIAPFKVGSEIYLYGTATPPQTSQKVMEVKLGMKTLDGNSWQKVLRIFGQRTWKGMRFSPRATEPENIGAPVPLIYEHAYGGIDSDTGLEFDANRAGRGFFPDPTKFSDTELPQIEIGPKFIKSPKDQPLPAGYGPLPVFWSPRKDDTGTLDEVSAKAGLCPFGDDLKPSFYNVAPLDQRFNTVLKGGEIITLTGFLPELLPAKPLKLTLPELHHETWKVTGQKQQMINPICDTLVIDTDHRTMSMIWRAGIPWSRAEPRKGWIILADDKNHDAKQNLEKVS